MILFGLLSPTPNIEKCRKYFSENKWNLRLFDEFLFLENDSFARKQFLEKYLISLCLFTTMEMN
jgi:hypothetical protein